MIKDVILITYTVWVGIIYAKMDNSGAKGWICYLVFLALIIIAYALLDYWYQVKLIGGFG